VYFLTLPLQDTLDLESLRVDAAAKDLLRQSVLYYIRQRGDLTSFFADLSLNAKDV
jgi:hypothetical protein